MGALGADTLGMRALPALVPMALVCASLACGDAPPEARAPPEGEPSEGGGELGEGEGEGEGESAASLALDAILDEGLASLPAPGIAACIVKDGAVAWCGGAGHARIAEGIRATADTPFLLASVSKTVTGVAAMQLVEDGVIALDDTIAPPFQIANPRNEDAITWRMLLTHTSSIVDNWDMFTDFYFTDTDPTLTLADTVSGYLTSGGAWYTSANFSTARPGTSWEYSNMGVALAGFLVEHETGQDFAARTDDTIFAPLGLTNTSWRLADFDRARIAMPYVNTSSTSTPQWVAAGDTTYSDYPDGGLRASARDVARFLACIVNGGTLDGARILDESTVQTMLTPAVPDVDAPQGVIWYESEMLGDAWWGHAGSELGVGTDMHFRPSDGLGFVLLVNTDRNDAALYELQQHLVEAAADLDAPSAIPSPWPSSISRL